MPVGVAQLLADPLREEVDERRKNEHRDAEDPYLGFVVDPERDEDPVGCAGKEDQGDEREQGRADRRPPRVKGTDRG